MVHITAINMQVGTYLKLKNATYLSKDFDLEEEKDSKTGTEESKTAEKDVTDIEPDDITKYFLDTISQIGYNIFYFSQKNQFAFSESSLLKVHSEITIPPPRA